MEDEEEYVPYGSRPEWSDIIPVPQDDGPAAVVRIAYSEEFQDVMSYLRAVMLADERSQRALDLTAHAIRLNPGNYTVWHYRRSILFYLDADLRTELNDFVEEIASRNEKNYQLWYHRRVLAERIKDPYSEFTFIERMLTGDAKNYHAWSHRQWVVRHFDIWDCELELVDELLKIDIRNNSAWNHRFFVVSNVSGGNKNPDSVSAPTSAAVPVDALDALKPRPVIESHVRQSEVEFALGCIRKTPNNESPWNYLRGMVHGGIGGTGRWSEFSNIKSACLEIRSADPLCPYALATLLDIFEEEGVMEDAIRACDTLKNEVDPIRSKYWSFRRQCMVGGEAQ